jgi:hypothetical protein
MFCASEQTHMEGKKPICNISNYFLALSGSGGFMDVAGVLTCAVEGGEKDIVLPKQAVRQKEVPAVELTKDEATDFCARASSTECSVKRARGAAGGRRPQLGGAGVLRGQVPRRSGGRRGHGLPRRCPGRFGGGLSGSI